MFLYDNIFGLFSERVFQQRVGILMDTNRRLDPLFLRCRPIHGKQMPELNVLYCYFRIRIQLWASCSHTCVWNRIPIISRLRGGPTNIVHKEQNGSLFNNVRYVA